MGPHACTQHTHTHADKPGAPDAFRRSTVVLLRADEARGSVHREQEGGGRRYGLHDSLPRSKAKRPAV